MRPAPSPAPLAALALAALALTGCVAAPTPASHAAALPAPPDPPHDPATATAPGAEGAPAAGASEALPHAPVRFAVLSRAGGPLEVHGFLWAPPEARTVLLAVPGSGGGALRYWGPVPGVPGYSVAHDQVARGRAMVAVELPGYGPSRAVEPLLGMEDYAWVLDQVAGQLRSGQYLADAGETRPFEAVVGIGLSMGGLLVDLAQGLFASFDGIAPAGWSHGGWSEGTYRCFTAGDCPEDKYVYGWHAANADPAVMDAMLEGGYDMPAVNGPSIAAWGGFWTCNPTTRALCGPAPRGDDVTERIAEPVLAILGARDWWWDEAGMDGEAEHFPASEDARLLLLEATGHAVFHHRNHAAVKAALGDWMAAHGW